MADDVIPEDLRDFILGHIDSIAQLEALLLLRRNPRENWTTAKAAQRLYVSEAEAAGALEHLCAKGLLTCSNQIYNYAGQTAAQQSMVDRLADTYTRHLIQVTNLIHTKPRRLREFSDAFKLRKERP